MPSQRLNRQRLVLFLCATLVASTACDRQREARIEALANAQLPPGATSTQINAFAHGVRYSWHQYDPDLRQWTVGTSEWDSGSARTILRINVDAEGNLTSVDAETIRPTAWCGFAPL